MCHVLRWVCYSMYICVDITSPKLSHSCDTSNNFSGGSAFAKKRWISFRIRKWKWNSCHVISVFQNKGGLVDKTAYDDTFYRSPNNSVQSNIEIGNVSVIGVFLLHDDEKSAHSYDEIVSFPGFGQKTLSFNHVYHKKIVEGRKKGWRWHWIHIKRFWLTLPNGYSYPEPQKVSPNFSDRILAKQFLVRPMIHQTSAIINWQWWAKSSWSISHVFQLFSQFRFCFFGKAS